jgi:hypothetical protein
MQTWNNSTDKDGCIVGLVTEEGDAMIKKVGLEQFVSDYMKAFVE